MPNEGKILVCNKKYAYDDRYPAVSEEAHCSCRRVSFTRARVEYLLSIVNRSSLI